MRGYLCIAAAMLLGIVHCARGDVLDYSSDYNAITSPDTIDAIGQTFTATQLFLVDASLQLSKPFQFRPFWTDAHLELRSGFPNTLQDLNANVLFRSDRIDLDSLQQTGSVSFNASIPLYELSLTSAGLDHLISLQPGATYTLDLVDFGTTGDIAYAEKNSAGDYPFGGEVSHLRGDNANDWRGPFNNTDLAFKVVMVPEPSTLIIMLSPLLFVLKRTH